MEKDTNSPDWRDERDDEGFPIANEDRNGDLFTDDHDVTYYCTFIEGLGWVWMHLGK